LLGYYSDPPGFSFYIVRINHNDEPKKNAYGLTLLDCNRGVNDVEANHKQYVALCGTWCTGVEIPDALLSEKRHRGNIRVNERKTLGYPQIGHYDTWKMYQLVVDKNHWALFYPYCSNASDLRETPESFDTIALHSEELDGALLQVKITSDVNKKLSSELRHLVRSMGVAIHFWYRGGKVFKYSCFINARL
jgi:hypothetical protein